MLLLLILLQPFILSHDFAMANFEINQGEETLTLRVKMDRENLEKIYLKTRGKTTDLTKESGFIQQYLDQHFSLLANDQKINFTLKDISKDDYFYTMNLNSADKIEEAINHIQLKNTCLVDEVDDHTNIVNFKINGTHRTFRLHEGRLRIEVKY